MASTNEQCGQEDVIAFLRSGLGFGRPGEPVEQFDTHGALIFLAGDDAYKIKRAVRYCYMDLSTCDLRRAMIEKEFAINRPNAPDLYLGTVAITREANGTLAMGGQGEPVEWALHMRRFDQSLLLGAFADRGEITPALARAVADTILESHRAARVSGADWIDRLPALIDSIFATFTGSAAEEVRQNAHRRLRAVCPILLRRAEAGYIRRCHGDLHLDNIVVLDGKPVLFDAIEFDENIATTDTLYDLAFLLMDLDRRGQRPAASVILNRYLWRSGAALDLEGLVALPLFLALRSGIRGMVTIQRADVAPPADRASMIAKAEGYLDSSAAFLAPPPARLIAIGGLSGTGKSSLAMRLAARIGPAPGAVHLRSDLERKALFGVGETERLPAETYTKEASAKVYDRVLERAGLALAAGHSVIVDSVFSKPAERAAVEEAARKSGANFTGLWLTAPLATLKARVAARTGDASDATVEVVDQQYAYDLGTVGWHTIEAGGPIEETFATAVAALRI